MCYFGALSKQRTQRVPPQRTMSDTSIASLSGLSRRGHRSLDIAARSLFEHETIHGTVASVVALGALSHHWNGLFQYAAIRVGAERATSLLHELRSWYEQLSKETMSEEQRARPGERLYRKMRVLLDGEALRSLPHDAPEWWVPAEERLASCVVRLRQALSPEEFEALELCYCRGIEPEDLENVLGISPQESAARLVRGNKVADSVIGLRDQRHRVTRERLLLQAFVLDPRRTKGPTKPSHQPVLSAATVIHGRYEIEALLGAGAFADVYRARDRDVTGHVVALKILRRPSVEAQAVRSALRELQLIASVFHPSVVQLKDHGWFEGRLWFVMPLYRGETLAQRLQRGPLPRREAREVFEVLAEALATMHRVGVRHQDIKPENVFLANIGHDAEGSGRVLPVLLDLGVAAKDVELVLAGTPAYFAPEVAARFSGMPDPPTVGPKADVFSLALTLRDALDPTPRDHVAAGAVDAFVSFRARVSPSPPWRRDLRDLAPVFERWLHHTPDMRPTAEEFRQQLRVLTRPEELRKRRASLLRWLVPSALALITLFSSVVYFLSKEASSSNREARAAQARATQASERAASMHASLEAEEAMRRQLEAEVASLERKYQSSRLTREQLAARLASVEGEAKLVGERQERQVSKLRRDNAQLATAHELYQGALATAEALRERRDELARELDRTKATLEDERTARAEQETKLHYLELQLASAQQVINITRAQIGQLVEMADNNPAVSPPGNASPKTP